MEKSRFLKWLLALSAVGIICILLFGRPGAGQGAPFRWKNTVPPTAVPVPLAVQLQAAAASSGSVMSNPIAGATLEPTLEPTLAPTPTPTPVPALTTAPDAFAVTGVVNRPLREAVADIAKNKPGVIIRPVQLGMTVPPSSYNPDRVTVEYDPNTLTVTRVTQG